MEIWLVRHGETDWNAQGRVQGWTDVPLNAEGRRQASLLAQCLKSISFEHIYASDLSRALDTARIVADAVGAPVTPLACLREHRFGQAEGLLRQESDRRFPNGAPDREPPEALRSRVTQCLQDIVSTPQVAFSSRPTAASFAPFSAGSDTVIRPSPTRASLVYTYMLMALTSWASMKRPI
ncbi:hypothetical protein GCM10025858_03710 [Alicyclobacillus sacchari]|nr:hypothetical protein GCM10025858_03710 [Alicyclobacillus sacchari]